MKNLTKLLRDITNLTTTIETHYPELYKILAERPVTIPSTEHPHITTAIMEDYLESLKQLLSHHLETHQTNK